MRRTVMALLLAVMPFAARGETVWVNDVLYLGVRPQPDEGKPVAVVKSGTELEVLERARRYLRVLTPQGVEGWVSLTYVSEEPPARLQLAKAQEDYARVEAELERARADMEEVNSVNTTLSAKLLELGSERDRLQTELTTLREKLPQTENPGVDLRWINWVGGMVLVVLISFGAGVWWYRALAMRRLGGLRI